MYIYTSKIFVENIMWKGYVFYFCTWFRWKWHKCNNLRSCSTDI